MLVSDRGFILRDILRDRVRLIASPTAGKQHRREEQNDGGFHEDKVSHG
jgi:hypothetical protein